MVEARLTVAKRLLVTVACAAMCCTCSREQARPPHPSQEQTLPMFSVLQSADSVTCYDFVEVTIRASGHVTANPFTDVFVTGEFGLSNSRERVAVDGFADAADGSLFRARFMPGVPGDYSYSITYWQANEQRTFTGSFRAKAAGRKGLLARDPSYPWHFIWTGTSDHYFLNGTTAFLLMGWDDERVIQSAIDRFHSLSINRLRVLLDGRTDHFWTEPVVPGHGFRVTLNPWQAERPDSAGDPGFDYARFDTSYWQKFERMLGYARDKDVVVSVILGWNDTKVHPVAGGADERRYIRYAVARLAAYSNVTWDLGDDLDRFRSDTWTHATGMYLYDIDPYHHLETSHPVENEHQDRTSRWFGMTSFQQWKRPLHAWMLQQREAQRRTGRIIPQVNEEYGYEDHYPAFAPYESPAASADADRRAAWEISMAGGYQTTGETAKRGTGVAPDTGGGWVNGRGDDTMTMLKGYAHMVGFFTSFEWWKAEPHDELVNNGAMCLAETGRVYVAYLPRGGRVTLKLEAGRYEARWLNPRNGQYAALADAAGPEWTSPAAPDQQDWVLKIQSIATRGASN